MKLVTFDVDGKIGAGYLDGDQIVVCADGPDAGRAILTLIESGAGAAAWEKRGAGGAARIAAQDARLLAPIPQPIRNIFCVGKNYYAHANEFHSSGFDSSGKEAVPAAPIMFTKATTSVVGPDDIVLGSLDHTNSVDYEGELGVVIGQRSFQVAKADAYDHVFGYVIINDVTSRELQRHHNQWLVGKSLDTFCPMGPYIVTADEAGDVTKMVLETRVNDEVRQHASVADLIFDIPTVIETMTATMTMLPGDILATGTCDGVGIGYSPPKFLQKGDRMSVRITGLGELNNTIG